MNLNTDDRLWTTTLPNDTPWNTERARRLRIGRNGRGKLSLMVRAIAAHATTPARLCALPVRPRRWGVGYYRGEADFLLLPPDPRSPPRALGVL